MDNNLQENSKSGGSSWATGSFEDVARPLIKWLAENRHPHHTAVVTSTHAELLEGQAVVSTDEYLKG